MRHYCSRLGWIVALAAAGLWAADSPSGQGNPPVRMTSVVRSDQRTGKLVRSVIVSPKPAAGHAVEGAVVAPRVVSPAPAPAATPAAAAPQTPPRPPSMSGGPDRRARIAAPAVDPLRHQGGKQLRPVCRFSQGRSGDDAVDSRHRPAIRRDRCVQPRRQHSRRSEVSALPAGTLQRRLSARPGGLQCRRRRGGQVRRRAALRRNPQLPGPDWQTVGEVHGWAAPAETGGSQSPRPSRINP